MSHKQEIMDLFGKGIKKIGEFISKYTNK